MSPIQLPLDLAALHANQQLFSDHYLNETLLQRSDWRMLAHDAGQALARITPIVETFLRAPAQNEAQTEDDLVKPVLRALGHTFEIQANLATPDGTKKPDYVFYTNQAVQDANKSVKVLDEATLAGKAFAVGDAKYWDRPLDMNLKTAGDPFSNKNPAYQIAFYIQHSSVPWGILTNGRRWRLYHRDTAYKQDRFYEVDLPALVAGGNAEAFLYFYAFFRREAFDDGPLGLAAILRESADYARGIGATLRGQVYDALAHLAQGFLDYPANRLDASDPATLKTIYDHSLIVLYRLLFVLYAEARELLPIRANATYRLTYSLDAIKRDVARRVDGDAPLLASSTQLWNRLTELFGMIDRGEAQLGIATFNGGLFDPQRYPFLERHRVGDARLLAATDKLARVEGAFIDYRDLAERHLGTIYEGLLEYHLQPDTSQAGFTVGLFNDRGERHRTGSYYTPDFVVQYIVEQTLRPVLDAAVAGKITDAKKIQAVLEVNCLDPAMGSGHFPVAATEYIARYLVDLGVTIDEQRTENPEPRTACSAPGIATTVDGSEFLVLGSEPDLAYWKRRVAQSCIYGVDLNPLAVDLAKLSLWLVTAASDRPLSFLDHHLRCGNALIGTRIAALGIGDQGPAIRRTGRKKTVPASRSLTPDPSVQASMLDDPEFARSMSTAVDSMWLIEASDGTTIEQVKEQERLYAALRGDLTRRYERLADVATARNFGVEVDATLWRGLSDYLQRGGFEVPQYGKVLRAAAEYAEAQRFFHWDLEFPEVFFDRHGRPLGDRAGFDAVFGNPPYVRQEQLAPIKPYLQQAYPDTYAGTADLYVYFVNQGVRLLRKGGLLSYIASNSWLRANYATGLRNYLRTQTAVEQLIDLGDNRVFADAPDVYPAIIVVRNDLPQEEHAAQVAVFSRGEGVKEFDKQVESKLAPVSIHDQADTGWQLGDDFGRRIFAKLMQSGKPLTEYVDNRMYYGLKTGLNDAFIINGITRQRLLQEDAKSKDLIKYLFQGEDLRPWYQKDEDRWLIHSPWELDIDNYPAVKNHLLQWKDDLLKRPECRDGRYAWWCMARYGAEYQNEFPHTKILWPDIGKFPRFSWDTSGSFINDKGSMIVTSEPYVLGMVQSRALWFCISNLCVPLGERAGSVRYQQKIQFISRLPIPDATHAEREAIGALAMQITEEAQARYALHRRSRNRILSDLGQPGGKLNQKLTAWWELDFPAFRAEIQKVFKRGIALKDRDDWEEWLQLRRAEHRQRTDAIIRMETDLNARVYALFDLTPDEIEIIETSTKYQYGEV